jgi:hypothetical protein
MIDCLRSFFGRFVASERAVFLRLLVDLVNVCLRWLLFLLVFVGNFALTSLLILHSALPLWASWAMLMFNTCTHVVGIFLGLYKVYGRVKGDVF